jgi:hypothetical protein
MVMFNMPKKVELYDYDFFSQRQYELLPSLGVRRPSHTNIATIKFKRSTFSAIYWLLRQIGGVIQGTLVSSTNKTDCHDITEILLKVVLNTMTLTLMTTYKFVIREIILIEFVSCNCFHSVRMSQYIAENVDLLNFMVAT